MSRALVISLHDVSPASYRNYRWFIDHFTDIPDFRVSLLVVPCWHQSQHLTDFPVMTDWLRRMADHGHEICLHGWSHRAEQLPVNPLRRSIATWYTDREGEFYSLDYNEAHRRIEQGMNLLDDCGLSPAGFVAPAWLYSVQAQRALHDCHMPFYTTFSSVVHVPTGRRQPAPVITASSRSGWRRAASRLWMAGWSQYNQARSLLRLAIHPDDLNWPVLLDSFHRHILWAARQRELSTYGQYLKETLPNDSPATC